MTSPLLDRCRHGPLRSQREPAGMRAWHLARVPLCRRATTRTDLITMLAAPSTFVKTVYYCATWDRQYIRIRMNYAPSTGHCTGFIPLPINCHGGTFARWVIGSVWGRRQFDRLQ